MKNEEGQNSSDSSLGTFMDALVKEFGPDFRWELAFAEFTEDMVKTLQAYGSIESLPADVVLYTHGDRTIDMFVVLDGEVDILLPSTAGRPKVYARHRRHNFTGEFNLLTSQAAVVGARTDSHPSGFDKSLAQTMRLGD